MSYILWRDFKKGRWYSCSFVYHSSKFPFLEPNQALSELPAEPILKHCYDSLEKPDPKNCLEMQADFVLHFYTDGEWLQVHSWQWGMIWEFTHEPFFQLNKRPTECDQHSALPLRSKVINVTAAVNSWVIPDSPGWNWCGSLLAPRIL